MPLYCGELDSIPELSKSWYATPAHRYRNCQCTLISNGYRISAECRNTPSCLALFQHLGRNITLPQIIQSRVNLCRFTIENGHDAPYRSIRDDVDISKDYVDIDAEPFSNLRHQRFRNFLGHILHPDQSLAFRQSHQRGVPFQELSHLTQVRRSIHIPALSRPMMQIDTVLLLEKIFMIYFPIQ